MQNYRHDYPVSQKHTDKKKTVQILKLNSCHVILTVPDEAILMEKPSRCKYFSFVTAGLIQIIIF